MRHIYLINNKMSTAAEYGIGTYINQIVLVLKNKQCWNVSIVNICAENNKIEIEHNIRTINIPMIKSPIGIDLYEQRYYYSIAVFLLPYIDNNVINIFHFNFLNQLLLIKSLKAIFSKAIFIVTIHSFKWQFLLKGDINKYQKIIQEEKEYDLIHKEVLKEYDEEKQIFNTSNYVIALSKETFQLLKEVYKITPKKIILRPNKLFDIQNKDSKLSKFSCFQNSKIILYVGRLDDDKGLDILIQSMPIIINDIPNAHLVIAGSGNFNKYLSICCNLWENITFTGKMPEAMLSEFYRIASLGVLPSFHEQCSYVAIEMMMHGLPIIGTNAYGLKDVIEEEFLINIRYNTNGPFISKTVLANKIKKILSKPDIDFFRKKYRKKFETTYLLNEDEILQLYGNL